MSFSQNYKDSMMLNIKDGFVLTAASSLPIGVAIKTLNSSLPNFQKNFFGGIWFSFGLTMDITAISKFNKACKYKKLQKQLTF
jgi:hypothetical protein